MEEKIEKRCVLELRREVTDCVTVSTIFTGSKEKDEEMEEKKRRSSPLVVPEGMTRSAYKKQLRRERNQARWKEKKRLKKERKRKLREEKVRENAKT